MKILIIRFSSIGDIVLTSPVIRCLRNTYPEAEIHFLVKKSFRQVIEHNVNLNRIHVYETDLKAVISTLKEEKFNFIIDLQKNVRSKRIKSALKTTYSSFPKLNILKWLFVNFKLNFLPEKSIVERYFKAVEHLNVQDDRKGLDFFIPEHLKTKQEDIPFGHISGFVACVIGGSFNTKQFPVFKWKEFCENCPYPIILIGGPEDKSIADEIASSNLGKIYNAAGKFNLLESADLVARSKVVVTNDTGLMHIAAAFQKPIISLWGNTIPDFGMFPYFGKHSSSLSVLMEVKPLNCRPCSKIGFDQCPKGHFKCMYEIPVLDITENIQRFWKKN